LPAITTKKMQPIVRDLVKAFTKFNIALAEGEALSKTDVRTLHIMLDAFEARLRSFPREINQGG
jgi:hypothetical protein